ncbi:Tumor protein p53-inducible protein 11-like, partial [Homarus americanus]
LWRGKKSSTGDDRGLSLNTNYHVILEGRNSDLKDRTLLRGQVAHEDDLNYKWDFLLSSCFVVKHSSGDLHSRLKTRKILGVGETDNGDIHRSKISQVLGHNEHLYVRLPRGFWSAHVLMGAGVTMETLLLLLMPGLASHLGIDSDSMYNWPPVVGLCVFVWSLLGTSDKHYARTMLLSMLTYHILSICVGAASALTKQNEGEALFESRLVMIIAMRAVMCVICLAYFYSIGEPTFGIRKSTSYKDLAKDECKKDI